MNKSLLGSVHGRFQPLHLGHEEYILEASKRTDYLFIGITQINPHNLSGNQTSHRYKQQNNPLTYFERVRCIQAFIEYNKLKNCIITPFPIEEPNTLHNFLQKNVMCYTTIIDDWNIEKINLLTSLGYEVVSLWDRRNENKPHSGKMLRNLCTEKGIEAIKYHVSPAVYSILEEIDFQKILLETKNTP